MNRFRVTVLAILTVCAISLPSAAMASDAYTSPSTVLVTTPSPPASVLATAITAPPTAAHTLPFTGGDIVGLVIVALVLLGAGTVLVRRFRAPTAGR